MARSKSSKGWLDEHFNDQYVQKAQQDGYRSRAAYKLVEINEKDKLIKPGMTVLDLGKNLVTLMKKPKKPSGKGRLF